MSRSARKFQGGDSTRVFARFADAVEDQETRRQQEMRSSRGEAGVSSINVPSLANQRAQWAAGSHNDRRKRGPAHQPGRLCSPGAGVGSAVAHGSAAPAERVRQPILFLAERAVIAAMYQPMNDPVSMKSGSFRSMSVEQTLLLGVLAGLPWLGGSVLGRLHPLDVRARVGLNGVGIAILVGLLWAVLSQAYLPLDGALDQFRDGADGLAPALRLGAFFAGGLIVGFGALAVHEVSFHAVAPALPAAATGGDASATRSDTMVILDGPRAPARTQQLGMLLAVGVGLRNLAAGLALGTSAAEGQIALSLLLVIGLLVHNGIEGIGMAAPFTNTSQRVGTGGLLIMGLIAATPTVVGAALGQVFSNDTLNVALLALAGGAILFVTIKLMGLIDHRSHRGLFYSALLLALVVVFAANMLMTVGGAGA